MALSLDPEIGAAPGRMAGAAADTVSETMALDERGPHGRRSG